MKKKYKVSLIALFAAFLSAILIAVFMLTARFTAVYAADRYVTVDGSNVFYTAIRGAEVTAAKETVKGDNDADEDHYYTLFKIGRDETVSYRKSLAYSWITGEKDDDGNLTGVSLSKSFSMEIGFGSLNFEKYIIAFQSQQYMMNKDKITKNYLVFTPQENGKVGITAVRSLDEEIDSPVSCSVTANARIKISFVEYNAGTVTVAIDGEDKTGSNLTFYNVYYPYASYVSSGDTAVTPLTFSAEFAENAQPAEGEEELTADMKLYELNGQSFEMFAHDSDGVYDDVKDNAPPVICFTQTPSYVKFGKKLDFNYTVIDVLATSPRSTAHFYVLTGDQYKADDFEYSKIKYDESSSSEGDGDTATAYKNPFITVNSSSDIRIIRDQDTFVPRQYLTDDGDLEVYGLIKIYYELSDVTGSSAQTDNVFVDWYAKDSALVNIYSGEFKNEAGKTENFLKVISGKDGATYAENENSTLVDYKHMIAAITTDYQNKIDKAIDELEDKKLYAGSDSNFYLPDFDIVFGDEYLEKQDYKYSIYYRAKSSGSNTSLAYNKLSIPLSEADVTYRFTVFITDEFGNPMRYPGENGEWQEITTDDIWDEDFADLLPFFEFSVSYKEATAENPDSHSVAYVGTSYSGVSFDIKGVSGTYSTKYNLYIFDRNAAYNELGIDLTYNEFVENFDALFANTYDTAKNTRSYFTTVKPASELQQTDENYELFKEINWNASSVSFVPQSAEDFYIVRLTLTDNRSQTSTNNFCAVAASIQANSLKGESDWVQNNIPAIVLLSVAGVLFIAFIVLLVVKPKDKGDIDEIYEKGNKSKKK